MPHGTSYFSLLSLPLSLRNTPCEVNKVKNALKKATRYIGYCIISRLDVLEEHCLNSSCTFKNFLGAGLVDSWWRFRGWLLDMRLSIAQLFAKIYTGQDIMQFRANKHVLVLDRLSSLCASNWDQESGWTHIDCPYWSGTTTMWVGVVPPGRSSPSAGQTRITLAPQMHL